MIEWGLVHRLNINFWCSISGVCSVAFYLHAIPQASYEIQTSIHSAQASHEWRLREIEAFFTQTICCFVGFENFHRTLFLWRSGNGVTKQRTRQQSRKTKMWKSATSRQRKKEMFETHIVKWCRCDGVTRLHISRQTNSKATKWRDKTIKQKQKNILEKKQRREKNMKWNEINREIIWKVTHTTDTLTCRAEWEWCATSVEQ